MEQKYVDKQSKLEEFLKNDFRIIEIGAGKKRIYSNSLTIDILDDENVDIICNLDDGLQFIPDNSIDIIYSSHVLEHLNNFESAMIEFYRILKPNGKKILNVPHFTNPYYYSDYTHKHFFGIYTFSYFTNKKFFKRRVPKYNTLDFEISKLKITFYSHYKFLNIFNKFFNFIFNMSKSMQEIYEAFFFKFIAAYEINIELKKTNND